MAISVALALFGVADDRFAAWRHRHAKVYLTADEEAAARRNFAVNDALINKHNSSLPYTLGHNSYSDQDLASQRPQGQARQRTSQPHTALAQLAAGGGRLGFGGRGVAGQGPGHVRLVLVVRRDRRDRGVAVRRPRRLDFALRGAIDRLRQGRAAGRLQGRRDRGGVPMGARRRRAIRRNSAQFSERPYIHSPRRSTPTAASSPRASTRTLRAPAAPPASAAPPTRRCSPL